jgi:hypothetical protein
VPIRTRDEEAVAICHDTGRDCGDLRRSLSGPKDNLGKALSEVAVVIDTGEPEVLERGLAQNLKKTLVRGLRRNPAGPDLLQEVAKLRAVHDVGGGIWKDRQAARPSCEFPRSGVASRRLTCAFMAFSGFSCPSGGFRGFSVYFSGFDFASRRSIESAIVARD